MSNTALNRTTVTLLTNKSGGAVAQGDVVILGTATAKAFTTTTTSGYSGGMIGVVIDSSIADNATGLVATAGWVPKINLSSAATLYDFIKTHTVAKQGVRHASPAVEGDFAQALQASATPEAILLGFPVPAAAVGGAPGSATYLTFDANGSLSAELVASAFQLVNEIKGWPPVVPADADLVTLNLWWDDVATPTTKATVVDIAGEAGITETYELAMKCVGDGAGDGLMQRFTYADEPRLKSGRTVSALVAIWSVSAVSVTAKLINSDASETAASAVTAAAWTLVEIPAHVLAGTYCDLQVTVGAAGTFYVVPLGMCIGPRAFALPPRPQVYVDGPGARVVNGTDTGNTWTDLDLTANTHPLATRAYFACQYRNNSRVEQLNLRRNGSSITAGTGALAVAAVSVNLYYGARAFVELDDGNICEYKGSDTAGDTEFCYLDLIGWWKWG